jgi:cytoskeletal protein RodZ
MGVEAGGIGARLRAGREKLGLTVLQVAERIHTDPKIVEAIEVENYEALGAPVYARGHIRHYAELVGESAAELIALYANLSKVAQPDLTRIVKVPSGVDSSKLVAPALLVMAVFAVAGAIWWVSALSKKKPQLSETHVVGEESPASAPESPPPDARAMQAPPVAPPSPGGGAAQGPSSTLPGGSAAQGRSGTTPGGNAAQGRSGTSPGGNLAQSQSGTTPGGKAAQSGTAASPGTTTTPGTPGALGAAARGGAATQGRSGATASQQGAATAPGHTGGTANSGRSPAQGGATAGTSATATAQKRTAAAATPAPASAAAAPPPPRSKNQAQVTLRYSADSWTEVYDASGARLFYDVGAAHSVQTVVGTPPMRVVLGNASGVAVEFNGHNASVGKLARPDGSVQFSINRSGRVVRAKPVGDGG